MYYIKCTTVIALWAPQTSPVKLPTCRWCCQHCFIKHFCKCPSQWVCSFGFDHSAPKASPSSISDTGTSWRFLAKSIIFQSMAYDFFWVIKNKLSTYQSFIHYITSHCITLHYIALHYITLHTSIHPYTHTSIHPHMHVCIHPPIQSSPIQSSPCHADRTIPYHRHIYIYMFTCIHAHIFIYI